jgi:hypothetical protein
MGQEPQRDARGIGADTARDGFALWDCDGGAHDAPPMGWSGGGAVYVTVRAIVRAASTARANAAGESCGPTYPSGTPKCASATARVERVYGEGRQSGGHQPA